MHGDIVGRELEAERVEFSVERAPSAHHDALDSGLFLELSGQLYNAVTAERERASLHGLVVHFSVVLRDVVVYRPSLQLRRRRNERIVRLSHTHTRIRVPYNDN